MNFYFVLLSAILVLESSGLPADSSVAHIGSRRPRQCVSVVSVPDAEFEGSIKINYGTVYIAPGVDRYFKELRCTQPIAVSQSFIEVCDWNTIPEIHTTSYDGYIEVTVNRRPDGWGQIVGTAQVTTHMHCGWPVNSLQAESSVPNN